MPTLLNISTNEQNPVYVDVNKVTALRVEGDGLHLYNEQGDAGSFSLKYSSIEISDVVQKLADIGYPLVSLPQRYTDSETPLYVLPSAVNYITVSQADNNGMHGVIAAVRGYGWPESNQVSAAELKIFLDAVKAVENKTLLEYTPDQATSRWIKPQALYIDPQAVTKISDDGWQVSISFEGNKGCIDVHVERNEMAVAKHLLETNKGKYPSLTEAFADVAATIKQTHEGFIQGLSNANPGLTRLASDGRQVFLRLQDIIGLSVTENKGGDARFSLQLKTSQEISDRHSFSYPTRAELDQAMQLFKPLIAASKAQPKKPGGPGL